MAAGGHTDLSRPLASALSGQLCHYVCGVLEGGFCVIEAVTTHVVCKYLTTALATCAQWCPSGTYALVGLSNGAVVCVRKPNATEAQTAWPSSIVYQHKAEVHDIKIHQTGWWIALACADKCVVILAALSSGSFRFHRRLTGFSGAVVRCTFSCDGRYLVALDENDSVVAFDAVSGEWPQRMLIEGAGMVEPPALLASAPPPVISYGLPQGYPAATQCTPEGDPIMDAPFSEPKDVEAR